jgi:hypothetical protein
VNRETLIIHSLLAAPPAAYFARFPTCTICGCFSPIGTFYTAYYSDAIRATLVCRDCARSPLEKEYVQ